MIPPPSQDTVGVCNQIAFLILYYISSRLVTVFKVIDAPIQVSDILVLTVCFKLINFSFQILFQTLTVSLNKTKSHDIKLSNIHSNVSQYLHGAFIRRLKFQTITRNKTCLHH
jgi:hypothetical protein